MLAGADETKLTREALKWPYGEFEIPNEVYDAFSAAGKKGKALEEEWNKVCYNPYVLESLCVIQGQVCYIAVRVCHLLSCISEGLACLSLAARMPPTPAGKQRQHGHE